MCEKQRWRLGPNASLGSQIINCLCTRFWLRFTNFKMKFLSKCLICLQRTYIKSQKIWRPRQKGENFEVSNGHQSRWGRNFECSRSYIRPKILESDPQRSHTKWDPKTYFEQFWLKSAVWFWNSLISGAQALLMDDSYTTQTERQSDRNETKKTINTTWNLAASSHVNDVKLRLVIGSGTFS